MWGLYYGEEKEPMKTYDTVDEAKTAETTFNRRWQTCAYAAKEVRESNAKVQK